ncbi:unnamed protein product [Vitrella brassicaformis CCMP3155]|uniref:Uncharacterized protein n=2 Tax=Vitrella brassicaformis TaxID=1169539 RepID=A0A0G4EQI7_VITBC|nr:unnamed protein product [Vitrella brassicaformis CCMP3155]|eukprot:CEL99901.1 unnamed protein product [Vitrella brassicaformis CCMP3155]
MFSFFWSTPRHQIHFFFLAGPTRATQFPFALDPQQLAGVRTEADLRRAVAEHLDSGFSDVISAVQGRSAEGYELELDFNQFDRRGLSGRDRIQVSFAAQRGAGVGSPNSTPTSAWAVRQSSNTSVTTTAWSSSIASPGPSTARKLRRIVSSSSSSL